MYRLDKKENNTSHTTLKGKIIFVHRKNVRNIASAIMDNLIKKLLSSVRLALNIYKLLLTSEAV